MPPFRTILAAATSVSLPNALPIRTSGPKPPVFARSLLGPPGPIPQPNSRSAQVEISPVPPLLSTRISPRLGTMSSRQTPLRIMDKSSSALSQMIVSAFAATASSVAAQARQTQGSPIPPATPLPMLALRAPSPFESQRTPGTKVKNYFDSSALRLPTSASGTP